MKRILCIIILLIFLNGCFSSFDSNFTVAFEEGRYANDEIVTINDSNVNSVKLELKEITKEEYNSKKDINVITDYSLDPDKYYMITFIFDFDDDYAEVFDLTFKGWAANQPNAYDLRGEMNVDSEYHTDVFIKLVPNNDVDGSLDYIELSFNVRIKKSNNTYFKTKLYLQEK